MTQGIFVSYRRSDSLDICGRICDRLCSEFGKDYIFQDVDTLPPGCDFGGFIHGALQRVRVVLVLMGPTWVSVRGHKGELRLFDPQDWVRQEVELALPELRILTVPVLLGQTTMPSETELPRELAALRGRNSARVRPDPDFDADMVRLVQGLRKQLPDLPLAPPSPSSSSPPTMSANVAVHGQGSVGVGISLGDTTITASSDKK